VTDKEAIAKALEEFRLAETHIRQASAILCQRIEEEEEPTPDDDPNLIELLQRANFATDHINNGLKVGATGKYE